MNEQYKNSTPKFGLTEIIGLAILIGVAAAIIIPNIIRSRATGLEPNQVCINNLRQIEASINEWALENKKTNGTPVTWNDIKPYIQGPLAGKIPSCPAGGKYTYGKVGDVPQISCSLSTLTPGHFIPYLQAPQR